MTFMRKTRAGLGVLGSQSLTQSINSLVRTGHEDRRR